MNNGDRLDELLIELEGCKWDAVLLSELGDKRKKRYGNRKGGHMSMGAGGLTQKRVVGIIFNKRGTERSLKRRPPAIKYH